MGKNKLEEMVRPQLSGNPDDMKENWFVIIDKYDDDEQLRQRLSTPFTNEDKSRSAYADACEANKHDPFVVVWHCKMLVVAAMRVEVEGSDQAVS